MKNILKRFGFVLTIIGVILGVMGFAPANAATGDGGATFTVTNISHGVPTVSTTLSNTQEALIGGATQMLWQDANFNGHLTVANVKQAYKYRFRVIATGANSSQVIYRKSHHRKEVVLLPRSKVRNTGLHNHIRGGFVWTTGLVVLTYDKPSHQYRHAGSLLTDAQFAQTKQQNPSKVFKVIGRVKLGGTVYNIVVWCGNYIGGNVVMFPNFVQVASVEDLVMESDAYAVATARVAVDFSVQCPNNGPSFKATGYAYASASASSHIRYTQHTKLSAVSAVEDQAKQQISIDQSVTADAQASITVSSDCGTPPPPSYQPPTASGNAGACVQTGQQTGVITATGTNPNSVAAPGTLTVGGKTHSFTSVGAGQSVSWDFSGFAPGDYQGSFTLGSPVNMSASFTVHVAECPTPVHQNPTAEIFVGEHAVDLYGTMPVFGRVKAFDGATATLGSPVVTPSDLGMISNWRTVSTERDGVTPCETGYVCYQGTFRVTKDGTPGTYVYGTLQATATDTMGGTFTTPPLQFSVYYANHPNT